MSPESVANIVLFIIFVSLEALGNKLEDGYICPVYCEVQHKHNMRTYAVNGKDCFIYKKGEEPDSLEYREDWREADEGDWVLTDDGHVIQILKRKGNLIQTCTGTYTPTGTLDTKKKKDIYSISGKTPYQKVIDRKEPTQKEYFFALRASKGQKPAEAYMEVYDTKNPVTAAKKAAILLKTERVQKLMRQDMKDVFEKLGANTESMVEVVWDIAQNGKNETSRLAASKMMWDAAGLIEQNKVTEVAGLFQGFTSEKLEEATRPKEIDGRQDTDT